MTRKEKVELVFILPDLEEKKVHRHALKKCENSKNNIIFFHDKVQKRFNFYVYFFKSAKLPLF